MEILKILGAWKVIIKNLRGLGGKISGQKKVLGENFQAEKISQGKIFSKKKFGGKIFLLKKIWSAIFLYKKNLFYLN